MMATLMDAALRSLLLAVGVWAGLRIFRVRNVPAQKTAWVAVLLSTLLMPAVLTLNARWHILPQETLVLPARWTRVQWALKEKPQAARAERPAQEPAIRQESGTRQESAAQFDASAGMGGPHDWAISDPRFLLSHRPYFPAPTQNMNSGGDPERATAPEVSSSTATNAVNDVSEPVANPAGGRTSVPFAVWLAGLYSIMAAALLFRLIFGLATTMRLWHRARPATIGSALRQEEKLDVRFSGRISSPVTIGMGVLLPADYAEWGQEKLRIVLAHERSHVSQWDFYWQMLASLYAALAWFSPLGWWLKHKLSELGETISDRAGLEEAADGSSYAQILLEFASAPHTSLIGVAMARPSSTSRRIERLLNDRVFRQAFAGGRRAFLVALLAPAIFFTVAALVHVQAATVTSQQAAAAQSATMPQTQAPVNTAPDAAPAPTATPAAAQTTPAPAPAPNAVPAPQDRKGSPVHVDVPAIHVNVPAIHVDVPAKHIDVQAIHVDVPARQIEIPAVHVDVPAQHFDVPAIHVNVRAVHVDVPAQHIDVPAIHIDVPQAGAQNIRGYGYPYTSEGQLYAMLSGDGRGMGFGRAMVAQAQSELTFDRTLTINGRLTLSVATGSGYIHLTRGSGNQVVIHGQVRAQAGADEAQARAMAANPPIEQSGNTIRIGAQHQQGVNHISIDYDIQAPADATLNAASGSGNIEDEGVGQGAKLTSGSGDIRATGLDGGFTTQTGSGNIVVNDAGAGDAKAQTGSGSIEIKGVHGSLKAQTGSGKIVAAGTPSAAWKIQTGNGSVALTTGNAPMTLDAETGSGKISAGQQIAAQNSSDHHHLRAQLNGGGPEVKVETGSGDIRVD